MCEPKKHDHVTTKETDRYIHRKIDRRADKKEQHISRKRESFDHVITSELSRKYPIKSDLNKKKNLIVD